MREEKDGGGLKEGGRGKEGGRDGEMPGKGAAVPQQDHTCARARTRTTVHIPKLLRSIIGKLR